MNKDEFNNISNNTEIKEYSSYDEYPNVIANNDIKEYGLEGNQNSSSRRSKQSYSDLMKTVTMITTTGAIAVTGAVVIIGGGLTSPTYDVNFIDINADEYNAYYIIDVGETNDLMIKVSGMDYDYEIDATPFENFGELRDLEPGTTYTIKVYSKESVLGNKFETEKSFTTLPRHEVKLSDIEDIKVEYECKCAIDGYFHFNMIYEDTEFEYLDFSAKIIDNFGNESKCILNGEYNSEQIIDIKNSDLISIEGPMTFVVTLTYQGEVHTIIEVEVDI